MRWKHLPLSMVRGLPGRRPRRSGHREVGGRACPGRVPRGVPGFTGATLGAPRPGVFTPLRATPSLSPGLGVWATRRRTLREWSWDAWRDAQSGLRSQVRGLQGGAANLGARARGAALGAWGSLRVPWTRTGRDELPPADAAGGGGGGPVPSTAKAGASEQPAEADHSARAGVGHAEEHSDAAPAQDAPAGDAGDPSSAASTQDAGAAGAETRPSAASTGSPTAAGGNAADREDQAAVPARKAWLPWQLPALKLSLPSIKLPSIKLPSIWPRRKQE